MEIPSPPRRHRHQTSPIVTRTNTGPKLLRVFASSLIFLIAVSAGAFVGAIVFIVGGVFLGFAVPPLGIVLLLLLVLSQGGLVALVGLIGAIVGGLISAWGIANWLKEKRWL